MNKIIYLLLFSTFNFISIAQINLAIGFQFPSFDENTPIWVYPVYDSTNIGVEIEWFEDFKTDGYNIFSGQRPTTWMPVIKGNHLYSAGMTKGTTSHIFGGVVQKINLETGTPVWTSVFDNRHINRQEYIQQLELTNQDQLEIITHRRINDRTVDLVPAFYNILGDYSTISKRLYNTSTGDLILHDYHDPEDPNIFQTLPQSEMQRTLWKNKDNSYQFIVNEALSKKRILKYDISETGQLIGEYVDTFYYDQTQYNISDISFTKSAYGIYKSNDDSLVTVHTYYNSLAEIIPTISGVTIYDQQLNISKFINFESLFDHYSDNNIQLISLIQAWNDRFLIGISSNDNSMVSYIYMDYDGRVLSAFDTSPSIELIKYSTYFEESDEYIAFVQRTPQNGLSFREDNIIDLYTLKNNEWILQHTLDFADNHYLSKVWNANLLENKDLLICYDHRYYDKSLEGVSAPSEVWARIDGTKLGFITSLSEISNTKDDFFQITPNPAHSTIQIASESDFDRCEIYDIQGQLVQTFEFDLTSNKTIDLSNQLANGSYVLKTINSSSHQINSQKLLIQK